MNVQLLFILFTNFEVSLSVTNVLRKCFENVGGNPPSATDFYLFAFNDLRFKHGPTIDGLHHFFLDNFYVEYFVEELPEARQRMAGRIAIYAHIYLLERKIEQSKEKLEGMDAVLMGDANFREQVGPGTVTAYEKLTVDLKRLLLVPRRSYAAFTISPSSVQEMCYLLRIKHDLLKALNCDSIIHCADGEKPPCYDLAVAHQTVRDRDEQISEWILSDLMVFLPRRRRLVQFFECLFRVKNTDDISMVWYRLRNLLGFTRMAMLFDTYAQKLGFFVESQNVKNFFTIFYNENFCATEALSKWRAKIVLEKFLYDELGRKIIEEEKAKILLKMDDKAANLRDLQAQLNFALDLSHWWALYAKNFWLHEKTMGKLIEKLGKENWRRTSKAKELLTEHRNKIFQIEWEYEEGEEEHLAPLFENGPADTSLLRALALCVPTALAEFGNTFTTNEGQQQQMDKTVEKRAQMVQLKMLICVGKHRKSAGRKDEIVVKLHLDKMIEILADEDDQISEPFRTILINYQHSLGTFLDGGGVRRIMEALYQETKYLSAPEMFSSSDDEQSFKDANNDEGIDEIINSIGDDKMEQISENEEKNSAEEKLKDEIKNENYTINNNYNYFTEGQNSKNKWQKKAKDKQINYSQKKRQKDKKARKNNLEVCENEETKDQKWMKRGENSEMVKESKENGKKKGKKMRKNNWKNCEEEETKDRQEKAEEANDQQRTQKAKAKEINSDQGKAEEINDQQRTPKGKAKEINSDQGKAEEINDQQRTPKAKAKEINSDQGKAKEINSDQRKAEEINDRQRTPKGKAEEANDQQKTLKGKAEEINDQQRTPKGKAAVGREIEWKSTPTEKEEEAIGKKKKTKSKLEKEENYLLDGCANALKQLKIEKYLDFLNDKKLAKFYHQFLFNELEENCVVYLHAAVFVRAIYSKIKFIEIRTKNWGNKIRKNFNEKWHTFGGHKMSKVEEMEFELAKLDFVDIALDALTFGPIQQQQQLDSALEALQDKQNGAEIQCSTAQFGAQKMSRRRNQILKQLHLQIFGILSAKKLTNYVKQIEQNLIENGVDNIHTKTLATMHRMKRLLSREKAEIECLKKYIAEMEAMLRQQKLAINCCSWTSVYERSQYHLVRTSQESLEKDLKMTDEIIKFIQPYSFDESKRAEIAQLKSQIDQIVQEWVQNILIANTDKTVAKAKLLRNGSFLMNSELDGSDLDLICVVPEQINIQHFHSFDGDTLYSQLKRKLTDSSVSWRPGRVPLIRIERSDQLVVDLLLVPVPENKLFAEANLEQLESDALIKEIKTETGIFSLAGYQSGKFQLALVQSQNTFSLLLKIVKIWAKNRLIYSGLFGFFNGIALSIIVTQICVLFPNAPLSFLLFQFFSIYNKWDWPSVPIRLREMTPTTLNKIVRAWPPIFGHGQCAMAVITPTFPEQNVAFNVNAFTLRTICEEFEIANQILAENPQNWKSIFEEKSFEEAFAHFALIVCSAVDPNLYSANCAYQKSKLRQKLFEWANSTNVSAQLANYHLNPKFEWKTMCNLLNGNSLCTLWLVGLSLKKGESVQRLLPIFQQSHSNLPTALVHFSVNSFFTSAQSLQKTIDQIRHLNEKGFEENWQNDALSP